MENVARWTARKGRKQQGFTLIELMVVVVILGALMLIVLRAVGGNADNATAKALQSSASELAKGAGYLHVALGNGISDLTTSNPVAGSGDVLDVLMLGNTGTPPVVAPTYQDRFEQLNMRALDTNFHGTLGDWSLQNFRVRLYGSSTAPSGLGAAAGRGRVTVTFDSVPTEVVQLLAESYGKTYTSTQDINGNFRWAAASNNQHSIAFILTP